MTLGHGNRVAFYAPMKSPHHPIPSGDREMARNLIKVIGANGADVELVSELRIYDKRGDATVQRDLQSKAKGEAARLIRDMPETDLWVTYHNYYKAPDLIGPSVARARKIPYVQIESTRATSRLNGPWAGFAQSAHDACDAADIIFYLTTYDMETLDRDRYGRQKLVHLPPFLPLDNLPPASPLTGAILTVGMMREGDKLASYHLIAQTLPHLSGDWTLHIAGDGPARAKVEAMMAPFGQRVVFLGQLDRTQIAQAYSDSCLFFWPGVNEAFGMVYLEAQSHGVPVVAQDRPGLRDVLAPGQYPAVSDGPQALAAQIDDLLGDADLRAKQGAAARTMISDTHLAPAATQRFWSAVSPLLETSL